MKAREKTEMHISPSEAYIVDEPCIAKTT